MEPIRPVTIGELEQFIDITKNRIESLERNIPNMDAAYPSETLREKIKEDKARLKEYEAKLQSYKESFIVKP